MSITGGVSLRAGLAALAKYGAIIVARCSNYHRACLVLARPKTGALRTLGSPACFAYLSTSISLPRLHLLPSKRPPSRRHPMLRPYSLFPLAFFPSHLSVASSSGFRVARRDYLVTLNVILFLQRHPRNAAWLSFVSLDFDREVSRDRRPSTLVQGVS